MSEELEKLLNAEQATRDILNALTELRAEIEGYAAAKGSLDGVRSDLGSLITLCSEVIGKADSAFNRLREMSMPEVLERITTIREDLSTDSERLRSELNAIATTTSTQTSDAVAAAIAALDGNVNRAIEDMRNGAAEASASLAAEVRRERESDRKSTAEQFTTMRAAQQEQFRHMHAEVRTLLDQSIASSTKAQQVALADFGQRFEQQLAGSVAAQDRQMQTATASIEKSIASVPEDVGSALQTFGASMSERASEDARQSSQLLHRLEADMARLKASTRNQLVLAIAMLLVLTAVGVLAAIALWM